MNQSSSSDGAVERAPVTREGKSQGCPVSSFSFVVGLCGVAAFLIAIFTIRNVPRLHLFLSPAYQTLIVMIVTALGVFIPDLFWKKVYLRLPGGTPKAPSPSWPRTMTKLIGLLGSMGFVGLLYWIFPEYNGSFYRPYYKMLSVLLPVWLVLAVPYIWWVDARMLKPEDGLWHTGRMIMLQWENLDVRRVFANLLGWLIKGFFLPLMFVYMSQSLIKFTSVNLDNMYGFRSFYSFFFDLFFLLDLSLCACGYLFTMRLTNTHIRSVDSTLFGWVVVLVCFEPFWAIIGHNYLAYESNYRWGNWLHSGSTLYAIWGTTILALTLIYVSSTIAFGMRYSNLTHRGILTSGPYRWSKHPAYISQNLSWWLISVPFIVHGRFLESLRQTLLLLLLNGIYYLRAKTEERHLAHDPVYVQYAQWIKENGLFAVLRRSFITLTNTHPPAEKGAKP